MARGCGWQHIAVYVNLATFYGIGMPIAVLLGFKFNLHAKVTVISSLFIVLGRQEFSKLTVEFFNVLFWCRACGLA